MKYQFNASADYEQIINERLKKLCSRFSKFPETVVKISTTPLNSGKISYDIEILTPVIKFEGYSHVATLKIETLESDGNYEDINIIFPTNKYQDEDFSKYFEANFRCDHCHTNRYRKTVHLFKNESGNDLMIASSCAKQYFGETVFKLLGLYETLTPQVIISDLEDIFERGERYHNSFNTPEYCRYAYGVMKKSNTYISQHKKEDLAICGSYIESTTDKTNFIFQSTKGLPENIQREVREERKECLALTDNFDIALIKEFWYNKYLEDTINNFNRSCFLNLSMVAPKCGLLAYAVSAYMREVEGAFNNNVGSENSEYVGSIGERMKNIKVTPVVSSIRETIYGLSTTIKFVDESGNVLTWFASSSIDVELNKEVLLTGTVKKHEEYKGKKQTILNRCKIN